MASSAIIMLLVLVGVHRLLHFSSADGDGEYLKSRATYYGTPDCFGNANGACGYGLFGRNVNGVGVAGGGSEIYNNGIGCGACYHVRCRNEELCREEGVRILITDYAQGNQSDFIMSSTAYSALAKTHKAKDLVSLGVVDIEYKRISCNYPGYNLMIKIDESSKFPEYLALQFWYQAGQKDVLAVELSQEKISERKTEMKRNHGALWDVVRPPKGALWLRFLAGGYHRTSFEWVRASNVIPADWKAGALYDSGIQIDKLAKSELFYGSG